MKVSLGIPYWGQDPIRQSNFEYALDRMSKLWNWSHIEWRTPIDCETRGGARNHLVRHLGSLGADLVVICDADTYVEQSAVARSITAATNSGGLHFPYDSYHYLTPEATEKLKTGQYQYEEDLSCTMEGPGSYGGCLVIRPDDWEKAGGSPELVGWGFEDIILSIQTRTLLRPDTWHSGRLTHLYHPSECDVASESYRRNIAECKRFEAAVWDKDKVRELIRERNPEFA